MHQAIRGQGKWLMRVVDGATIPKQVVEGASVMDWIGHCVGIRGQI
jgi:hypothetical protein